MSFSLDILQLANDVNEVSVGKGNLLDCTGTSYMTGKTPGVDDILNLGISYAEICVIL